VRSLVHVVRDWWQALTGGQALEDVHRAAHAPRYRPGVVETPAATEEQLDGRDGSLTRPGSALRGGAAVVGLTPSPDFAPPALNLDGPPAATEQQLNAWLPPYLEGMCSAKLEDRATGLRLSCNLTPGHRGPHHDPDGSMWDGLDVDPWMRYP
jgi:hypothetical protein